MSTTVQLRWLGASWRISKRDHRSATVLDLDPLGSNRSAAQCRCRTNDAPQG